ncbi:hypothetical protein [Nocardioides sp. Root151]|uniref:hypothetical protein n=1 Tax=Nocardioides sp. Root151 TaxID=1736475 RepID=UPI0007028EC6|nr:hypothetical protein [Nocardioides sp. Root151]KQZ70682.1 hypothetical protein ASD66_13980 [Nocardioides sp. Root151]
MPTQQVESIRGRFERLPTREHAAGATAGSIAISHRWVAEKKGRRRSTGRWYRISAEESGGSIFRVLTFDPTLSYGGARGDLVIDWSGWLVLTDYAEDTGAGIALEFRRARWWHYPRIAVTHPDPVSRVALRVSAVAFVLGVIPFLVSLVGWLADLG